MQVESLRKLVKLQKESKAKTVDKSLTQLNFVTVYMTSYGQIRLFCSDNIETSRTFYMTHF